MLLQIKELLKTRELMSLTDLARHFYVSESIMEDMLTHWQKKGRLEVVDASGACGTGCGTCSESEESKRYYRWKPVAEKPIFTKMN